MHVEGDTRCMQINFGGHGIFGFGDFCPFLFAFYLFYLFFIFYFLFFILFLSGFYGFRDLLAFKWPNFPSDYNSPWGSKIESAQKIHACRG